MYINVNDGGKSLINALNFCDKFDYDNLLQGVDLKLLVVADVPNKDKAFIIDEKLIIVSNELIGIKREYAIFHELGHFLMHDKDENKDRYKEFEADVFACVCILKRLCHKEKDLIRLLHKYDIPKKALINFNYFINITKTRDKHLYTKLMSHFDFNNEILALEKRSYIERSIKFMENVRIKFMKSIAYMFIVPCIIVAFAMFTRDNFTELLTLVFLATMPLFACAMLYGLAQIAEEIHTNNELIKIEKKEK